MVVSSFVTMTLCAEPSSSSVAVVELEADLFRDDGRAGQDRDVLEHGLATLTKSRRLDGDGLEGATNLVHDEGREGFALDVFGDDEQRTTRLHDLLEHGEHVTDRGDLARDEQDVGVLENGLLALEVGREVRGDVALVKAHAFDEVHVHPKGLALFDGDDAVLADLVDGVGDHLANLVVGRGDRGHLGDLLFGVGGLGEVVERRNGRLDGGLDALLQRHRVGAGGDVLQSLADHGPGEHGRGRGAVTGDVVGLLGDFFDQLGADLLEGVFEVDVLGDRDTVVRNGGGAPLLVQHDVAALWSQGDADGVGQLVHSALEGASGLFVKSDQFRHG